MDSAFLSPCNDARQREMANGEVKANQAADLTLWTTASMDANLRVPVPLNRRTAQLALVRVGYVVNGDDSPVSGL